MNEKQAHHLQNVHLLVGIFRKKNCHHCHVPCVFRIVLQTLPVGEVGAALHEFLPVYEFAELYCLRKSVFCHISIIALMFLPQEIPSRRAE